MEKVFWIVSERPMSSKKPNRDGLEEVNALLEQGWRVKHISAAPLSDMYYGQAYVVLEKDD